MKRKENTEPLKEVIERFLKQYRLDKRLEQKKLEHQWRQTVGELIARKTRNFYLNKEGTLLINIESSVIRDELQHAKEKLREQLNEAMGYEMVKSIVLK